MCVMVANCGALFKLAEKQTLEASVSLSTLQTQACLCEVSSKTPVLASGGAHL